MEKLALLEEKRLDYYQDYRNENFKAIIFLISGILIAIFGIINETVPMIIIGVVLFIISIIFFSKANKHLQAFRILFKNELIVSFLTEQYDDVIYQQKGFIPISRINELKMIQKPDRYTGEDYIQGSYKGIHFELSDVDLEQRVQTTDSKGNTQTSYQTYFRGRWYIFTFDRMFKDVLKIIEGKGYQMSKKELVKIETESIEFNNKFTVYASNLEYGFYHITSLMIEKFLSLEKMHRGSILYCFKDNELHIGVNDRKDYLELSIKKPINEQAIKDFEQDINLIRAIIEALSLDSSKFKTTEQKGEL